MGKLVIDLTLKGTSPVHVTGNRWKWGVDKVTAQDEAQQAVIPATSIKGNLRASALMVLRSWGIAVCRGPEPDTMCSDAHPPCPVCQVFGNPGLTAPVKFFKASPRVRMPNTNSSHIPPVEFTVRSGVSLSRHRRAALSQRLFFIESAEPQPAQWGSRIEGIYPNATVAHQAAALLVLSTRYSHMIGGNRSRGLGWIEAWESHITWEDREVPVAALEHYWQQWARGEGR